MSTTRTATMTIGATVLAVVLAACAGPASPDATGGSRAADGGPVSGECAGVHAGQPAHGVEHCDALALADPANATHAAATSGPWSDRATWAGGDVPDDGAAVHVPADAAVTVDGEIDATHDTVRIDGTLRFDPAVTTELRVDTLVGSPDSAFEMGTAEHPIDPEVTATVVVADRGPIDQVTDPMQLGRGVVLHGTVDVHGADRTGWEALADGAAAGSDQIELATVPAGWRAGDRLVTAGVRPDGSGDEQVEVVSVDGSTVSLDRALQEDHTPPRADLDVHVANLTRNAIVRSESTDLDRRGHVMFMHTRDVRVANAGFYDLGRTDKSVPLADVLLTDEGESTVCRSPQPVANPRARYSVHFHRNGVADDGSPATVTGSVVDGNPGWGFVNHSSNVDFVDNVAYDVAGAGFSTEVGDEVGAFVGNLSIRNHGPAGVPAGAEQPTERRATQDFGWEGHGFWLQGPGVRLDGNVAAGASGAGVMIYAEPLTEPVIGRAAFGDDAALVPVPQQPLAQVTDTTTYGSVTGLWIYYHRTGITLDRAEAEQLLATPPDLPPSVIEGVRSYANLTGVRANYTVDTEFRDVTIVAPTLSIRPLLDDAEARADHVGFDATNVYNHGAHRYVDFDIEGYPIGLRPSAGGEVTIEGGRFASTEADVVITPPRQVDRQVTITGDVDFVGAEQDGRTTVAAEGDLRTVVDSAEGWYQLNDRIIVELDGEPRQLFYEEQHPDVVLFDEQPEIAEPDDPGEEVPEEHIGLTNAELAEEGGPLGGTLLPADARPVTGFGGLVGSPTAPADSVLDSASALQDLLREEVGVEDESEEDDDEAGEAEHESDHEGIEADRAADRTCAGEEGEHLAELAAGLDDEDGADEDGADEDEADEDEADEDEADEDGPDEDEADEHEDGDEDDDEDDDPAVGAGADRP